MSLTLISRSIVILASSNRKNKYFWLSPVLGPFCWCRIFYDCAAQAHGFQTGGGETTKETPIRMPLGTTWLVGWQLGVRNPYPLLVKSRKRDPTDRLLSVLLFSAGQWVLPSTIFPMSVACSGTRLPLLYIMTDYRDTAPLSQRSENVHI